MTIEGLAADPGFDPDAPLPNSDPKPPVWSCPCRVCGMRYASLFPGNFRLCGYCRAAVKFAREVLVRKGRVP